MEEVCQVAKRMVVPSDRQESQLAAPACLLRPWLIEEEGHEAVGAANVPAQVVVLPSAPVLAANEQVVALYPLLVLPWEEVDHVVGAE